MLMHIWEGTIPNEEKRNEASLVAEYKSFVKAQRKQNYVLQRGTEECCHFAAKIYANIQDISKMKRVMV